MKGPFEQVYELETNDPHQKLIRLSLAGNVKPVPDFSARIANGDVARGGTAGSFLVWPCANPIVPVEPKETLSISLRLRPGPSSPKGELHLGPDAPSFCKLRREQNGEGYWLDMSIEASDQSDSYAIPLRLVAAPPEVLNLKLSVNVLGSNLVVTPRELNLGELSLKDLGSGSLRSARVGVRKQVGAFKIKSLSSTLEFLRLEQQTIVDGSNYLIRIRIVSDTPPKPGEHKGALQIETDDGKRTQVPVKVVFIE